MSVEPMHRLLRKARQNGTAVPSSCVWRAAGLLALLTLAGAARSARAEEEESVDIARAGRPQTVIVLARDTIAPEETAARELAAYLNRATGATFEIVREGTEYPAGNLIYVGPTRFAAENGINASGLGPEQWIIRTVNGSLVLAGGRPRGVLYSVFHFLEEVVGVRWWNPWEEHVPVREDLVIGAIDLAGAPVFRIRNLNTVDNYISAGGAENRFAPRNRLNIEMARPIPWEWGGDHAWGPPYFVHTEGFYLRRFRDRGDLRRNPDWIALKDGRRELPEHRAHQQLCLSNESLREAFLSELRAFIEGTRNREAPPVLFDVSLNDMHSICECPGCAAIQERHGGQATGLTLDFVNYMADGVRDDYPEVIISTLAYLNTEHVPKGIKPRANVMIVLCDTKSSYTEPVAEDGYFAKRLAEWSRMTDKLYVWEYRTNYGDLALPMPYEATFQPNLQLYRHYGVIGVMSEYHKPIFEELRDLRLWLMARLLEDPYQDQKKLILDFTDGFYGPAGVFIRQYIRLLGDAAAASPSYANMHGKTSSLKYLTPEFVLAAQAIFNRAEEAVRGQEVLLRRVRHARLAIDKANLSIFPRIWQYHLATGASEGKTDDNREEIADRLRDTVEQQWRLRAGGEVPEADWRPEAARTEKNAFLASIDAMLRKKLVIITPPRRFSHLPDEKYTDYPADGMTCYDGGGAVVYDPDAETGIAIRAAYSEDPASDQHGPDTADHVFRWDMHDYMRPARGDEPTIARLAPGDVPGPGYHWYKLGTWSLTENNFLWIYHLNVEVSLRNALDPLRPGADYEVWARIKFEGPAFPHGAEGQENAIFMERVVAVAAE